MTQTQTLIPAVDIVTAAMADFWGDEVLSYKAGDYDSIAYAMDRLIEAGHKPYEAFDKNVSKLIVDLLVEQAAVVSFAVCQDGVDQATDRRYHAMIAAILLPGLEGNVWS